MFHNIFSELVMQLDISIKIIRHIKTYIYNVISNYNLLYLIKGLKQLGILLELFEKCSKEWLNKLQNIKIGGIVGWLAFN